MRVTWVQPEDLVGHELRQSREEGKDVDAIEARWLAAGGAPAPPRGASPDPVAPELRRLALDLLDELDALPRPWADREPEGLDEILALCSPARAVPPDGSLGDRVAAEIFALDQRRQRERAQAFAALTAGEVPA